MALSYVSAGRPPVHTELCADRSVVLFEPRLELGAMPLGDRIRRTVQDRAIDALVVRGSSPDLISSLEADPIIKDVVGNLPVFALVGSHDEADPKPLIAQPGWSVSGHAPDLADLRQIELQALMTHSGAIRSLADFHFVLPSTQHADKFIRLADALDDSINVVRVADWLLEFVDTTNGGTVIADNGSMAPLLFAMKSEALRRFGVDLTVANLPEYPRDYMAMDAVLTELYATRTLGPTLLIVSVRSSGGLETLFNKLSFGESNVVTICSTDGPRANSLVSIPVKRWTPDGSGMCEVCPDRNSLYVEPRTYQIIPADGLERVSFDFEQASRKKEFWEAADRSNAVRLHCDDTVPAGPRKGRRHLAVNFDIAALLADETFHGKTVEALMALPEPARVLIPNHECAPVLTELAGKAFPALGEDAIVPISGKRIDADALAGLGSGSRVLVLDDALVSGWTLVSLRRQIYEAFQAQGERDPDVFAFVVLARAECDADQQFVARNYTESDGGSPSRRLFWAERLLLPSECPWCEEAAVLARLLNRADKDARKPLEERVSRLQSMAGLDQPISLDSEGSTELQTHGSFIGTLRQRAAFAAAMGAAHVQRLELEQRLQGAQIGIIKCDLSVEAFRDPVIVGGLFRTVPRRFTRAQDVDAETGTRLLADGQALGNRCLGELAWAAIVGRLPAAPMQEVLESSDLESSAMLRAFKSILDLQNP